MRILTTLLVATIWTPNPADACIPIPDASGLTNMTSRRAVVWVGEKSFDLVFQNRYSGSADDFAWVIPLPGVPTEVGEPAENLLDDLERYTAPMFEKQSCYETCPTSAQRSPDAGISSPVPGGVTPPDVTVWGSGSLGDLEYVVLSSSNADELTNWLDARDFTLDDSLKPLVGSYLDEGWVFFAAKLATKPGTSDAVAAVPAVKLTFDRAKTAIKYPLRISAYNRADPLETLIWVIAKNASYVPKNYPFEKMDSNELTKEAYVANVDAVMGKAAGTMFAVEFAGRGDYDRKQVSYGYSSSDSALSGIVQQNLSIVRLRARLNPKGTNEDLELNPTAAPLNVSGWYMEPCAAGQISAGECNKKRTDTNDSADGSGCNVAVGAVPLALMPLVALALMPLLALALRHRRRRRR